MKLTEIAGKTIESYFKNKNFELPESEKEKYKEKRSCFVTLTKNGHLRGCIGSLVARQELWKDIQENVINACFHDFRFTPLKKEELKDIKIEVSVLTAPKKLNFRSEEELLKKINRNMGIILKKGAYTATFLPQVWKQISNKTAFLEHLSLKAGLDKDAWKTSDIYYYNVYSEEE